MLLFSHFSKKVAAVVLLLVGVFASVAYANHAWGNYHWARTANPFTLKLGDNVSSVWDAHLTTASSDWSLSSVLDAVVTPGQTNPKNCRPTAGRVEVCNSKYGNNGWLGIAQIWANGDHVTQGVTKLNDTYFNTAKYNTPAWRGFVVCQEVGHTFGLDHQDVNFNNLNLGTCMDYTNNPSRNDGAGDNLHPNVHDYAELETIYAHLDSVNTVSQSTGSKGQPANVGQNVDLSDPSAWGKKMRQDALGRNSLYERDLGNGEKLFTFVIWAE